MKKSKSKASKKQNINSIIFATAIVVGYVFVLFFFITTTKTNTKKAELG